MTDESLICPHCSAPGKPWSISSKAKPSTCGCLDYDCGTSYLCRDQFPEPEGLYRSAACHKIEEKGGWDSPNPEAAEIHYPKFLP